MNYNNFRGPGLGRMGRMGGMRGMNRRERYLDEVRIRDLDYYDIPEGRGGGMRFRDGSCRFGRLEGRALRYRDGSCTFGDRSGRFDGRGLRLRDGSCRYPNKMGRGMYYRDQRLAEIEKEILEKKAQKEER